jgi:biopolymer transport protein ExbD
MLRTRRHRNSPERIELQMTAMVDVVFLLLIFFLVTRWQEDLLTHMDVIRPRTVLVRSLPADENILQVTVRRNGFALHGRSVGAEELEIQVGKIASYSEQVPVLIRCADDSPHGLLVRVLDMCARHRLTRIRVVSI